MFNPYDPRPSSCCGVSLLIIGCPDAILPLPPLKTSLLGSRSSAYPFAPQRVDELLDPLECRLQPAGLEPDLAVVVPTLASACTSAGAMLLIVAELVFLDQLGHLRQCFIGMQRQTCRQHRC